MPGLTLGGSLLHGQIQNVRFHPLAAAVYGIQPLGHDFGLMRIFTA